MSRVNLIEVTELMDQHLFAEFREIKHIGKSLQRSLNRKQKKFSIEEIPRTYTLNTGHVKFFYDKGKFLEKRFNQLKEELIKRNYKIDVNSTFNIEDFPTSFRNDYIPSKLEIEINLERINSRINQKPNWYRKTIY